MSMRPRWGKLSGESDDLIGDTYLYLEDRIQLSENFVVDAGLRGSAFLGDDQTFVRAEPRLNLLFRPHSSLDFHASGSRMVQYLHLISNTAIRFPNDLWLPSSEGIVPGDAWQGSAGMDWRPGTRWKVSVEGYYKVMNNLYAVPDGFDFVDNINLETPDSFLQRGSGWAYGVESAVDFQSDNTSAGMSYVWARTERRFPQSNLGQAFPHDYDRRHQFKIWLIQRLGERWQLGMNWVYFSPRPRLELASIERGLGLTSANLHPPGQKNQTRVTAYHRLDLSLAYTIARKVFAHRFKVGVFNAYNQGNITFYRLNMAHQGTEPVFAIPLTPSLSYSIRF